MSDAMFALYIIILTVCFEIVSAGVLVYAIAISKVSSKKIIKTVLIGTVLYIILSVIPVLGTVFAIVVFTIAFCILGSQTGQKFNVAGFVSLIAYLISLFILPVISNKKENPLMYEFIEKLEAELKTSLTPTQLEILTDFFPLAEYSENIANYFGIMSIMFAGVTLFAIILFEITLLRRNTAQMVIGSILSVFAAGMLYLDYRIFHSGSLGGQLAGMALSKMGFYLSPFCLLIMLFAILTVITAYRCKKKER